MPNQKELLAKKALVDQKQDRLTAGSGISIDPLTNVISATSADAVLDVKVNNTSVVDVNKNANIDLTSYATTQALAAKQDQLTAGTNITIDANNVISASGGGSSVTPNPQGTPTDDLETIEIDGTVYDIPGGDANYLELTQDEYDALTPAEKMNGTIYFITDGVTDYEVIDVLVDNVSVVTDGVAEIDLSGKQDVLTAGTNITIDANNVISASGGSPSLAGLTDVNLTSPTDGQALIYDATNQKWINGSGGGGGTTVEANPVDTPTDSLNSIKIGTTTYDIPGSGGGSSISSSKLIYKATDLTFKDINFDISMYDLYIINASDSFSQSGETYTVTKDALIKYMQNNVHFTGWPYSTSSSALIDYTVTANGLVAEDNALNFVITQIYGINLGANGSGGYSEKILWEDPNGLTFYPQSPQTIALSASIDDFDLLYLDVTSSGVNNYHNQNIVPVKSLYRDGKFNGVVNVGGNANNCPSYSVIDETHLSLNGYASTSPMVAWKVVGIKIGGGSDNTQIKGAKIVDTLWSGSETPRYPNTYTATLSHSVKNYDFIVFDAIETDDNYRLKYIIDSSNIVYNQIYIQAGDGNSGTVITFLNELSIKLEPYNSSHATTYTKNTGVKFGGTLAPMIYNLEEQEIGVWIDDKPLYQRTFDLSNTTFSDNSWTNNVLGTVGSGINIVDFNGFFGLVGYDSRFPLDYYRNSSEFFTSMSNNTSDDLSFRPNMNAGVGVRGDIVNIYYTKTTDVPGSGKYNTLGVPNHHYNGDEKIVGTWFSETLYEKTFLVNNPSYNATIVTWDTSNLEIQEIEGVAHRADGAFFPLSFSPSSNNRASIYIGTPYNGIYFEASVNYSSIDRVKITVRYTKSS